VPLNAPDHATAVAGPGKTRRGLRLGLPVKLLMLTAAFVMLAEVLIFVPSVANFRINWMNDRLDSARIAALAAVAVPGGNVPETLRSELLETAQVKAVAWRRNARRRLVLPPTEDMAVSVTYDLRPMSAPGMMNAVGERLGLIADALEVFVAPPDRIIRIVGALGDTPDDFIEVVTPLEPLREAMLRYGLNILILSIVISLITAALVYIALSGLLVRPMMRITENMLAFSDNPEDPSRIIRPSSRTDEVGTAERELAAMQTQLSQHILQKNRLAQLGLAVSKINHDLRNMLASAQLLSDRLSTVSDPTVQRFAPKLIASLDRAISFCNDTLRYGRAEEAAPRRVVLPLAPVVEEVGDGLGLPRPGEIDWQVDIPEGLSVDADPDHLFRILGNVCRNAVQALEAHGPRPADVDGRQEGGAGGGPGGKPGGERPTVGQITISASREARRVTIQISDNGPGLPPRARDNLFRAFEGSQKKGGTGLGLNIALELTRAHGGTLRHVDKPGRPGALFEIVLPDRLTG